MATAEIDGGRLRYDIAGEGAPLLLLLPQSSGPNGIGKLIDALAMHHTVITYDQRGTGGSSPAPPQMSMAQQAADATGLLDALKLERASLLCHSTGCGIGIALAATHASRIDALVLAAPWTHGDHYLTTMQNLRKTAARSLDPVSYARFNAALLFPPDYRQAHSAGFDGLAEQSTARPQDADEIARRLDAILAFDARPLFAGIKSRTLVAVAKDDQLMPPWFASAAAGAIDGAEFVEFDGGGHMFLETRPIDLSATIVDFLKRGKTGQTQ